MARANRLDGYWFNEAEADRVCAFFEKILRHTEGIWAGEPFILTSWQAEDIIRPLYGWMRYDPQWGLWVRRYSRAQIWLPRGNGKSEIASGMVLEGLTADGEIGAECYGAAEDKDQATVIYRVVEQMVKLSPLLNEECKLIPSTKTIVHLPTNSFYRALPRDEMGTGAQGFKVHVAVVDEYWVQKMKNLVGALKKGMGKRIQPLFVTITTVGNREDSPEAEDYRYAKKVLAGEIADPNLFVYIREAPEAADPFDEETWNIPNPALGDFLSINTLREEAREAREKPSELNSFLQFRLNRRVKQVSKWIPLETWDATAGILDAVQLEEQLRGRVCYGGLDLASSIDFAALVWDFPDPVVLEPAEGEEDMPLRGHTGLYRFFFPEDRLEELDRRTNNEASQWAEAGFITLTPGDYIDYKAITRQIERDGEAFQVAEVAYDRWGMTQLAQDLDESGLPIVPMGQGFASMSGPTKEWEKLIVAGLYRHGGHPVMRWMFDNIAIKSDENENVKISKKHSGEKVDGPVAAVMALGRAILAAGEPSWIVFAREELERRRAAEEQSEER
jgi:phage terminase large subunit-like protein